MRRPITVKQLGNYIRAITLEDVFLKDIYITGEVTNLSKKKIYIFLIKRR